MYCTMDAVWHTPHCSLSLGTAVMSDFWLLCLGASPVHWCSIISMVHVGGSALLPFKYPCTYYSGTLSLNFSRYQHKWHVNSRKCKIQEMKIVHFKLETTSSQYYHNMTARYPHHAAPYISQ